MNIKRNIIFALESRKKNGVPITENVPIRMRVIFASQRIEFTTGYRIDATKWDTDKQRVKNGCTNKLKLSASEINADLLRQYMEIQNIFKEFEVQNVLPTPAQIKDSFNARMKDEPVTEQETAEGPKISFWEAFEEFVRECGKQNDWTDATYEKFAAVKNHLKEFRDELSFDTFTENGLNDYVDFLRNKKDMRNSTIGKQIAFLKWFLRWSFKKGQAEKHTQESDIPHMGGTEQTERLQDTPNQAVSRTGKGRFSVLLFQRAALFGRVQPQTERHQARPYRSDNRKDSGQPYHRVKQPQQGDTGKIQKRTL